MSPTLNILGEIRRRRPTLKRSEARVADLILEDPQGILTMNIMSLARHAGVSDATISRFCRSVGCAGFPDFKLRLAECQARGTPFISQDVAPEDSVPTFSRKIFSSAAAALNAAGETVNIDAIARAIEILSGAPRVLCIGMGGSSAVARDAAHKLLRLGIQAEATGDPILARMRMVNLGRNGAVVAVSNTGRTTPILELAKVAGDFGIAIVAITTPGSPLAAHSTVALGVKPVEDAEIYTPMASRLIHLTMIDVLSTGVALKLGATARRHLATVKTVLSRTWANDTRPAEPPAAAERREPTPDPRPTPRAAPKRRISKTPGPTNRTHTVR